MNAKRDYYEVLELQRDATPEDIKKAFRRLALRYHPDRNKKEDAGERFKEINEAYQVLSDPQRKAAYDRFGHAGVQGDSGRGFQGFEGFGGLGDIFDAFFGGQTRRGPRRGRDLEYRTTVSFEEAAFGIEKELKLDRLEVCDRCRGNRAEPGTDLEQCSACRGSGQVRRVERTVFGQFARTATCSTCGGEGHLVRKPCAKCGGSGAMRQERKLAVEIPAGIEDGSRLRLRNEGEPGELGGPLGDLYVYVGVRPHELFRRQGNDILLDLELNIAEAALGTSIEVPTLDGARPVKVPAGTQTGQTFKIKGSGIPFLRSGGRRGDELVTVRVVTPTKVSDRQRALLEELAGTLNPDGASAAARDDGKGGLFGRIFAGDKAEDHKES